MAGGFKAEDITIGNYSASIAFAEWAMEALMNFTASLVLMITKGWSEQKKAKFDKELRNNFMEAREKAEEAETRAWIAVIRTSLFLIAELLPEQKQSWAPVYCSRDRRTEKRQD